MKTSWLVVKDSLRVAGKGLDVEIRLPWYRGLPLSTVDIGEARINGKVVDPSTMSITINGKERPAASLKNFYEEYWYVLDSAFLHIPFPDAKRDAEYEVEVTVILYPPYIPGIPFPTKINQVLRAN